MARLPAGQKPTPRKVRVTKYRDELRLRGGDRITLDLEEPANSALQRIIESDTPPDADRPITQKLAVSTALLHYDKACRRRK